MLFFTFLRFLPCLQVGLGLFYGGLAQLLAGRAIGLALVTEAIKHGKAGRLKHCKGVAFCSVQGESQVNAQSFDQGAFFP